MNRSRSLALAVILGILAGATAVPLPAAALQVPHPTVVSPDPADWTPHIIDGQVNAVLQVGNKVVVGGTFTQVREANHSLVQTRNYLFAFDMGTGEIDSNFVPQLDRGVEALALAPDGTSVFVGGDFSLVNGVTYRKLARIRLADGQAIASFKANANALVQDLVFSNGWLYVSGKFTQIKSTNRSAVARLDPATGNVDPDLNLPFTDPLRGSLGVPKIDVSPNGDKLLAIGSFSRVAGLERIQIAMLDVGTTPATVSSWQTSVYPVYQPGTTTTWCSSSFATYMRDVDISPDGGYFIVITTGAFRANRLCDTAARWELGAAGPSQQPTWVDWSGGDTSWSVSGTGTAIYVGGHFRWWNNPYRGDTAGPGAVAREGIVALDPINGLPLSWNPGHDRGVGIFTMPATADGLWAGSDTDHAGGEFHQKLAFFPVAGGAPVPPNVPYALPNDLYNMELAGDLARRAYDFTTFGARSTVPTGVNWTNARGAFALKGKLYTGWNDGTFLVRDFDGTNAGPATAINLNGLNVQPPSGFNIPGTTTRVPAFTTDLANMTGMFFDNGRIYYTVSAAGTSCTTIGNNNRLYYRYFTPESQIVGANLFVASTFNVGICGTPGDQVPWGNVRGMTVANEKLIYATTDGRLWRVDWVGGRPSGVPEQIAGPGITTENWASRGLFAFSQVGDSYAPTQPGRPVGTSSTFDSIDLAWTASSDNLSTELTYRVYRDGDPTPVGTVTSDSSTTVGFSDTGLPPGTVHTYTVDAVDGAGNPSAMSDVSDPVTVLAPDVTPPTDPGTPAGISTSTSTIDLSWAAAVDDESGTLTYRVYRDDPSNQVGTVVSDSTTTVGFIDSGLAPGSLHTYWVDAVDESDNATNQVSSDPIQVLSPIFSEKFGSGDFSQWTSVVRLSIDTTNGSGTPPSARGNPAGQSAYAYRDLSSTYPSACFSVRINATALGGSGADLFRLRTAGGGSLVKVLASASGTLSIRSDVSGEQISSGTALGSGWHTVELCGTVGTATSWDLYRDGTRIVNAWTANTGTSPIGRIQIGDTAARTWTINFDTVILDTEPGNGIEPDTTAPTVPGRPSGSATGPTSIAISWGASFDDSQPVTYRVYRDGIGPIVSTTSTTYTDTGLTPGTSYTYAVDAVDAVQNESAVSQTSDPISTSSTIFADDLSTGDFSRWTAVTNLSIDPGAGAGAPPSAVGSPVAQAAFAYRDLSIGAGSACLSVQVDAASQGGTAVDLFRLRTSTGGPIAKVFVNASGNLAIRSDFSGAQVTSTAALGLGWHLIELCGSVGTATSWDLYRDGSRIVAAWTADTGASPIGRVQIGDTSARTWTIHFDDVQLDTGPG